MGATVVHWTDRSPATIVWVHPAGRRLAITYDDYRRVDENGMSEMQEYVYTTVPDAPQEFYTLRKNGRWVREGEPMNGGQGIAIGHRRKYHDFSF